MVTVEISEKLAEQILHADSVCSSEGIGPYGGEWEALVENIRAAFPDIIR